MSTDLVWYACYGSNLNPERFVHYLIGGTPPGGSRIQRGARDPSPPLASRSIHLPYALYFAGESRSWGAGGVAFVDHPTVDPPATIGRAYLLTAQQFEDVVAQESGRETTPIDLEPLAAGEPHITGGGWYDMLLPVGVDDDGVPIVTFTCPQPLAERESTAPGEAYLTVIVRGIASDGYDHLDPAGIADYLLLRPGVSKGWSRDQLLDLTTSLVPFD